MHFLVRQRERVGRVGVGMVVVGRGGGGKGVVCILPH